MVVNLEMILLMAKTLMNKQNFFKMKKLEKIGEILKNYMEKNYPIIII